MICKSDVNHIQYQPFGTRTTSKNCLKPGAHHWMKRIMSKALGSHLRCLCTIRPFNQNFQILRSGNSLLPGEKLKTKNGTNQNGPGGPKQKCQHNRVKTWPISSFFEQVEDSNLSLHNISAKRPVDRPGEHNEIVRSMVDDERLWSLIRMVRGRNHPMKVWVWGPNWPCLRHLEVFFNFRLGKTPGT